MLFVEPSCSFSCLSQRQYADVYYFRENCQVENASNIYPTVSVSIRIDVMNWSGSLTEIRWHGPMSANTNDV
jgi:hypothetical protein